MCGPLFRMCVGMMVLLPSAAFAATLQLPRTGQTACWDTDGNVIECASAVGQDANKAVGVALPAAPRFTEPATANGTLTDKVTDLVWLKNADCLEGARTWREAMDRARSLANGACGLSDNSVAGQWRVPNRKELLSLTEFQRPQGAEMLAAYGFLNGVHDWYWSSDTYIRTPVQKWVFHPVGDAHPGTGSVYHALFVRDLAGITVIPATQEFGTVAIQAPSAPRPITIANSGNGPLTVSSISFSGADGAMFAVAPGTGSTACSSLTPTIEPAASCTVDVTFTPATAGAKTASLRVSSNADNQAVTEVALTGTGTTGFVVAATVDGANGAITSNPSVTAESGTTAAFTVAPATGFQPNTTVGGTCPTGSFTGTTYTTGAITASCTVTFSFVPGTAPIDQSALQEITKAYRSVIGRAELTAEERTRFDVAPLGPDGRPQPDGAVDVGDVVLMLRKLVGVINW